MSYASMPAAAMLLSDRPLRRGESAETVAGVDRDQLRAGVHDHRAERDRDLAVGHVGRGGRLDRLVLADVDDEVVRHGEGARAVHQLDDLKISDLVAIDATALDIG